MKVQSGTGRLPGKDAPSVSASEEGEGDKVIHTIWKCEQLRAGQVYERITFNTREQAVKFAREMQRVEPDVFFNIEPMEASLIWN